MLKNDRKAAISINWETLVVFIIGAILLALIISFVTGIGTSWKDIVSGIFGR